MSSIGSDESVGDHFFLSLDGLRLEYLNQEYCGEIRPFKHQVATERLIKNEDCESLFLFIIAYRLWKDPLLAQTGAR
jgi:hypothetical protein